MGDFSGVKIIKVGGGLGRRNPSTDGVFGLIANGVATEAIALGEVKKLIQPTDAEDLGIDASYDANNNVLVHYHISEFFRINPDGTLYIMVVLNTVSMTSMCDIANDFVRKMVNENKDIKYVGIARNPASDYEATYEDGLDTDIITAIAKGQELIDTLRGENKYLDGIMLEGRDITGTVAGLKDLRTLASKNMSIVIAQDVAIAGLGTAYAKHASIGTALGSLSIRKVEENLGSLQIENLPTTLKGNENFPLTNVAKNRFITVAISSGKLFNTLTSAERKAMKDKGYIFAGSYEGYPGIYFNGSATCTELADDYNSIERNRVWNKAARYVITALTPKINSKVQLNNDGTLKATVISDWENRINKQTKNMLIDDEVSAISIYIDPKQNILAGEKFKVKLSVIPVGIAEEIEAEIGFTNPLTA